MSETSTPPAREAPVRSGFGRNLPPWLRPREAELPGTGQLRLIETTVLLILGLLLAIATINDVVLQTHVNHRLVADLHTWRAYTGHDYKNLSAEQDQHQHTTIDVVCGNTVPGPPKERIQLCLRMSGPVIGGSRKAAGGWYLPPKAEDLRHYRYGCFGSAKEGGECLQ
jgi:hypothetical protein